MAMNLSQIKTLSSVDLEDYEIRAAKYGLGNAQSTAPLLIRGTYEPPRNELFGSATFDTTDSSTANGLSFDSPFGSYDAFVLKEEDRFFVDSTSYGIVSIMDATSVELDASPGVSGTTDFTSVLGPRDYLIEPDVGNNTTTGDATFTSGSIDVYGVLTSWLADLTGGDFIKPDSYQLYMEIDQVLSNNHLELKSAYSGTTVVDSYQAKRYQLGRQYVQYTKDDFTYDKNRARWELEDSTTGSKILTSASTYISIADGIKAKFRSSISQTDPDISESSTVLAHLLAKSTEADLNQFPLPAVPLPEDSLELYINDVKKDKYPDGNRDYVVSYGQDPVYTPPPPISERNVASLMFLDRATDVELDTELTYTGQISFADADGNAVSGIMPGSEDIRIDGTSQQALVDYVVDSVAGTVVTTDTITNENVVNYIAVDYSDLIDYGIKITLDGVEQKYSIPPTNDDDVKIVLNTGRFKPAGKNHPAPGEEYIVDYHTDAEAVTEVVEVTPGMTVYRTRQYPIKNMTAIVFKNDDVLVENEDYRVSYPTGRIVFFSPLVSGDSVSVNYTPLSKQRNGMTYSGGKSYATVYDSRLTIENADRFEFKLLNVTLDPADIKIFRIYNETKNKEYDITGYETSGKIIRLASNPTNISIGLAKTDTVIIDYKFESESLEYPVTLINYTIPVDSSSMYIIGHDVTAEFAAGSTVRFIPSNVTRAFVFTVASVSFDGEDTTVTFEGEVTEDIVNPSIAVTDEPPSLLTVSATASAVMGGSNQVDFPGVNIPDIFRANAVLKMDVDTYVIQGSEYVEDESLTRVNLAAEAARDYTSAATLSGIEYSDSPLYVEGDTVITTSKGIVIDPVQPAIKLEYQGSGAVNITTDATSLTVDTTEATTVFDYATYPTVSSLDTGISSLGYLTTTSYVSDWTSGKILQISGSVAKDVPLLLEIAPALRLNGVDTTNFEISGDTIILSDPLTQGQRYNFDYQGRRYLGNSQVVYTADYFVPLLANSKVVASFEYSVLDQFYVQVMSQRYFLENIIEPKAEAEAQQQQGNAGQGGNLPSDEDLGNAEGGIEDDEYKRRDTEIECSVFDKIFDYFNDRLLSYSNELYCSTGLRICNNDGPLSEPDQNGGTKSYNRMWPVIDHTNLEPLQIGPLTGTMYGQRAPLPQFEGWLDTALFTNGHPGVECVTGGSLWTEQIRSDTTNWIRPSDGTKDYLITSVISDTSVSLAQPYDESTITTNFAITSSFPLFDDDGHMGAKIVGSRYSNFRIESGDVFDCTIDGVPKSHPFGSTLRQPELIADEISDNIDGLICTYEWVFTPESSYGYQTYLVLRTDGSNNCLVLGDGSAVSKAGFTSGDSACGNRGTDMSSEAAWDASEASLLDQEKPYLSSIISAGSSFKLDRTDSTSLGYAQAVQDLVSQEIPVLALEQGKLNCQIAALNILIQETGSSGYADASAALAAALSFQSDTSDAQSYADSIVTDWEGRGDASNWVLDHTSCRQDIYYKDPSTGIGHDTSGPGYVPITGQTFFVLQVPSEGDARILNNPPDVPVTKYISGGAPVPGSWAGWQAGAPVYSRYSIQNDATFTGTGAFTGPMYVNYQTISDRILDNRYTFTSDRSSVLDTRRSFMGGRTSQIMSSVSQEELFRSTNGEFGNLYVWANNRFNRRQGCEAKLKQIEAQIAANQSALGVTGTLL